MTSEEQTRNNLTPAENHAFNDLLLQLQSHYEFDATVVEDVSSTGPDGYSDPESILLTSTMSDFNSQSSETDIFQEYYTNEEIENYTDMEAFNTEEFQLLCDSTSLNSRNNQQHGRLKSLLNFNCESILNKSGTSLLPLDDYPVQTKEISMESNQKVKRRQFELDSGLSGSYWQIDNDEASSWAVRPRRSKAGSILKSLTKESMKRRRSERNGPGTRTVESAKSCPNPDLDTSPATTSASVRPVLPVRRLVTRSLNKEIQSKAASQYSKSGPSLSSKPADKVEKNQNVDTKTLVQPNPPLRSRLRRNSGTNPQPDDLNDELLLITEELSCFCVMAIPQSLVPTSHTRFLKGYKDTTRATKKINDHKRWIEDVVPEVVRLGNNRLLINNRLVRINYTDYVRESDVVLKLDTDVGPCENMNGNCVKLGQNSRGESCQKPYCRLGCVCESIRSDEIERPHCGRPKCFFDCCCLFKNRPANTDDSDIRSRLRPRVSLLNWKDLGRVGNDPTDHDFVVKGKPAGVKKHIPAIPVVPPNRTKRNVQPPSRLRDEFVLGSEPIRSSSGRGSQLQKVETEKKIMNSKEKVESRTSKTVGNRRPVLDGVGCPTSRLPTSRLPVGPRSMKAQQALPSELKDVNAKPIISARYLYNHSLLRRMHNCRPCFVRLTRISSVKPAKKTYKRQVAMKSSSRSSARFAWLNSQRYNPFKQRPPPPQRVAADPLLVMEMHDQNTFVLVRPNGTVLSFLCWSLRRNCVPTARIYRPEAGDSGSYPWLRLPVPPSEQAWMFYELPKNFTSVSHIMFPGMNCVLSTETLSKRLWETEVHGKTQKLYIGDYLSTFRRSKFGSIYIVKNLPNIIICGPFRKKKLKPLPEPCQRDALDFVTYSLNKNSDEIELRLNNDYQFDEDPDFQDSDTESLVALDDTSRDADLIPPDVMMSRCREFMISADQNDYPASTNEGKYDVQYDLDYMFRDDGSYSPKELATELEDPYETRIDDEADDQNVVRRTLNQSEYEVIEIDDDDEEDVAELQTKTDIDNVPVMASQVMSKVPQLPRSAPPGSVLVPLSGNSKIYFLVAPIK